MLDENKWLAARHGLDGELVDLPVERAGGDEGRSRAGCWTACASTPRTSARPPSSPGSRTCWSAATAPRASSSSTRPTTTSARSWREIVDATVALTTDPIRDWLRAVHSEARPWRPARTSSSSARTAGRRSARTSPSARTAGRGCASGRRRSSATARSREPQRRARPRRTPRRAWRRCAGRDPGDPRRRDRAGRTRRSCSWSCRSSAVARAGVHRRRRRASSGARRRAVAARHGAVPLRQRLVRSSPCCSAIALFGWLLERRHGPLVVRAVPRSAASAASRSRSRSTATRSSSAPTAPRWRCSPRGRCATCCARRARRGHEATCSARR